MYIFRNLTSHAHISFRSRLLDVSSKIVDFMHQQRQRRKVAWRKTLLIASVKCLEQIVHYISGISAKKPKVIYEMLLSIIFWILAEKDCEPHVWNKLKITRQMKGVVLERKLSW
ncbi:uncharacterized protein LOC110068332 [Orbicella faveolata]|uniref:uncharacterized protein LOC110068332 n=1 Tax=Orbicella faveolata TaxID=48498 RepID=UPI0009E34B6C|nr:uncharacterized protein LOC110068332 [Orbicella faveolata]